MEMAEWARDGKRKNCLARFACIHVLDRSGIVLNFPVDHGLFAFARQPDLRDIDLDDHSHEFQAYQDKPA